MGTNYGPYNPTTSASFANPSDSTITTPSTEKHAGFGVTFTPQKSGSVNVQVYGRARSSTAITPITIALRSGTGGAPAANAAATGTVQGKPQVLAELITALTVNHQIAMTAIVQNLVVGTAYWFDLTALCAAGNGVIENVHFVFIEQ